MYFIVSGTVLVQVGEKDKVTGITKKQVTALIRCTSLPSPLEKVCTQPVLYVAPECHFAAT